MKKCPNCGTILDDSKKKCYMCGTDLTNKNKNVLDNFDDNIGAAITKGQDNVFNNGEDIKFKEKDLIKKNNDNMFFSQESNTKDYFGGEINKLNSMSYDNRSNLKKGLDNIFGNKDAFKSKDDIQKKKKSKEKEPKKIKYSTNSKPKPPKPEKVKEIKEPKIKKEPKNNNFITEVTIPEKKVNEKNIANQTIEKKEEQLSDREKFFNTRPKNPVSNDITAPLIDNKRIIINIICIIIFIGMMIFIYFNFLRKEPTKDMAGLIYEIDDEFKLSSKDSLSRYYVMNNDCAIRINYGATNDTDGFVDNYLDNIKDTYAKDKNATAQYEELKINDNIWTSLSIVYLPQVEGTITSKKTPKARYRYTAIINKGNFYTIIFVNSKEDDTCSEKYDNFMNSLNFDTENN